MPDEARKTRKFNSQGNPTWDHEAERAAARSEFSAAGNDREAQVKVLVKYPFLAGPHWRRYGKDLLPEDLEPGGKVLIEAGADADKLKAALKQYDFLNSKFWRDYVKAKAAAAVSAPAGGNA